MCSAELLVPVIYTPKWLLSLFETRSLFHLQISSPPLSQLLSGLGWKLAPSCGKNLLPH